MLQKLKIKNIALIDECIINFSDGLNTLTGETGAGKSIIIDSLNFVLGARGDKTLIKSGTDYAKVDAIFYTEDDSILTILDSVGIDRDNNIIVSRVMNLNGKNECRINGEACPLSVIKKITSKLVDVFGQNDQQFILDTKQHLSFLDSYKEDLLIQYKNDLSIKIDELNLIKNSIKEIGGDGEERIRNIDILSYQINEIASANLRIGEEEELQDQKEVLKNSEKITEKFNDFKLLANGQMNLVGNLKMMVNALNSLGVYIGECNDLSSRLTSAKFDIEDIVDNVESLSSKYEYSEHDLDSIEERLDYIKTLERKYGKTIADVMQYKEKAEDSLKKLENATEELEVLNEKERICINEIYNLCCDLTAARKRIALEFKNNIREQLVNLGMKNAQIDVSFTDYNINNIEAKLTYHGADEVEFLFSANLGEPLKPLVKIISGGEMSRLMLAFKTVINNFTDKTYVFDEIDTGIGGSVGTVVAKQMTQIATFNQVLCVTHLAQIGCFADKMLKIVKYEDNGRTYTSVKELSPNEKVEEVMRLIGTNEVNEFAYKHAEELIKEANNYKLRFK